MVSYAIKSQTPASIASLSGSVLTLTGEGVVVITGTGSISGSSSDQSITVTNPAPSEIPSILSKGPLVGKVTEDSVTFSEMFESTNSLPTSYNFISTPNNAAIVNISGQVTISNTFTGETFSITARHKQYPEAQATTVFEQVTPKLTGFAFTLPERATLTGGAIGEDAKSTLDTPSVPAVYHVQVAPSRAVIVSETIVSGDENVVTISNPDPTDGSFAVAPIGFGTTFVTVTINGVSRTLEVTVP